MNKNLDGISQEESLRSPEGGGNCINWIVGHIIVTRDALLEFLGLDRMCDEKLTQLYIQGAEPIGPDTAEDVEKLMNIFKQSQVKINKALEQKDYKDVLEMTKELAGFGFHEAYHIGQTGILRRILGKPAVIN